VPDLDSLLRPDLAETAADAATLPDFGLIERRGLQRRRNRNRLTAAVAAAAAVLVVLGGTQLLDDERRASITPVAPSPSVSPSVHSRVEWLGPVRAGVSLPPVSNLQTNGRDVSQVWRDPSDAALGGIDLRMVTVTSSPTLSWKLELRGTPPRAARLDPARRVIEFGLVVDANGDRVADCEIGINTDTPRRGDFRVWMTNLRTEVTREQLSGPYGIPIDFGYPDAPVPGDPPELSRTVFFLFFGENRGPCGRFEESAGFYAWAAVRDNGRVSGWDYAPDAGWLRLPAG
jgi:hypothetical protein